MTTPKKNKTPSVQLVPGPVLRDMEEAGVIPRGAARAAAVEDEYPTSLSGVYLLASMSSHNSTFVGVGKHFRNGLTTDGTVRSIRASRAGVVRVTVAGRDGGPDSHCLLGPGAWGNAEELS